MHLSCLCLSPDEVTLPISASLWSRLYNLELLWHSWMHEDESWRVHLWLDMFLDSRTHTRSLCGQQSALSLSGSRTDAESPSRIMFFLNACVTEAHIFTYDLSESLCFMSLRKVTDTLLVSSAYNERLKEAVESSCATTILLQQLVPAPFGIFCPVMLQLYIPRHVEFKKWTPEGKLSKLSRDFRK